MAESLSSEEVLQESLLSRLAQGDFGFIDAGASKGGSLDFCEKRFQRGRGLGVDISSKKVAITREAGYNALLADLIKTPFPQKCVSFSSMMDFLEHLPSEEMAVEAIENLTRASRDFLFIRHPSFDFIEELKEHNLKFDWTDWKGHTNMMRIEAFPRICDALGLEPPVIFKRDERWDSSDEAIVPLSSPTNTIRYDEKTHGPKPFIRFSTPVYKQYDIFIRLNSDMKSAEWEKILEATNDERRVSGGHTKHYEWRTPSFISQTMQRMAGIFSR